MLKKMVGEGKTIQSASKVDLARLPPCRRSLIPHIRRVNFRAAQWKNSHVTMLDIPPAIEHGWAQSGEFLEPVWSEGPVLPSSLEDILAGSPGDDSSSDEDTDNEDAQSLGDCYSSDEDTDSD